MATPHIGPSRTVKVFKLFTEGERPVYQCGMYGREYTLDGNGNGRQQVFAHESLSEWDGQRIAKAEAALGLPCHWRETGTTEVMDVSF